MIKLAPISVAEAKAYFERHSQYRGDFSLAIAAKEEVDVLHDRLAGSKLPVHVHAERIHGVIALCADGNEFSLGHISTDGNAQIGSLLYGGAWRAAKALGYETIRI